MGKSVALESFQVGPSTIKSRWKAAHILLAFAAVLAWNTPNALADDTYYRWLDDNGETIISDRPPAPGVDYEIVSTRSNFSEAVSADGEDDEAVEEEPEKAEAEQAKAEWCDIAKNNLATLKSSKKITMRDENGELKLLSEDEKNEQIAFTQDQVNAHCKE